MRTRIAMKKNASHVNIELDEVDRFWLTSLLMMNVARKRDEAHPASLVSESAQSCAVESANPGPPTPWRQS
ncbi:MAG: hypothetical protein IPJ34_41325 [Myxococcales bacterium]|nr:hypothetical protein [Myxococcales bacterium]